MSDTIVDALAADDVRQNVVAADWQDLVRQTGDLLVRRGLAEERYTRAMLDSIETHGPYLVIAPGLALLHARPEDGALAPGLVMLTLAEPVSFGHSTNDPVRVALGLTAIDNTGHLDALTAIAATFSDPTALDRMATTDFAAIKENHR